MRFPTFVSDKYGVRDEACPIITGGWGGARCASQRLHTARALVQKGPAQKRGSNRDSTERDPTGIRLKRNQPGFD